MKKIERLSMIVDILERTKHTITAEDLAIKLKVSTRTIYRDIATLAESGLPVIGEAGTGYLLEQNQQTHPVTLDANEREAALIGLHMIKHWSDKHLSEAAQKAIGKIMTSSPVTQDNVEQTTLFYPPTKDKPDITIDILSLRRAIKERRIIEFEHTNLQRGSEFKKIHPIGIAFFGPSWMLIGWCPDTQKFSNFRVEHMRQLIISSDHFSTHNTPNIDHFVYVMKNSKPANTDKKEPNISTEITSEPDPDPTENIQAPDERQTG